jgi:hypothetical protein
MIAALVYTFEMSFLAEVHWTVFGISGCFLEQQTQLTSDQKHGESMCFFTACVT